MATVNAEHKMSGRKLLQIEMRKIAVEQLQRLQRATAVDDVIASDVTSGSQDDLSLGETGDDDGCQLPAQ